MNKEQILKKRAVVCSKLIAKNKFYLDLWKTVKHGKSVNDLTEEEILKPFFDFRFLLSDMPSNVSPFGMVDDLSKEYEEKYGKTQTW